MKKYTVHRPNPNSVITVRELIDILSTANPDALVIGGHNMDDCEYNIERIVVADHIVAMLSDPTE